MGMREYLMGFGGELDWKGFQVIHSVLLPDDGFSSQALEITGWHKGKWVATGHKGFEIEYSECDLFLLMAVGRVWFRGNDD
jgi:hypothetical protein